MKIFNVKLLMAFLVLGLAMFTACDETTTTTDSDPYITSITPTTGDIGTELTITGGNFGSASEDGSVYFGTVQAKGEVGASGSDYISWTDTQIKVKIPAETVPGTVAVKVYNGTTGTYSTVKNITVGSAPSAPSNAQVASKSNVALIIKWTCSTDDKLAYHKVYVYDGATLKTTAQTSDKTTDRLTVSGLTEGVVYTFKVVAVNTYGLESTQDVSVSWSPASRFYDETTVKMYEYASSNGSGIDLYDATSAGPKNLGVSDKASWNIGIDTRNGKVMFQTGTKCSVGTVAAQVTEMNTTNYYDNATSLDNVFDSQALSTGTFTENEFELNPASYSGDGLVIILRTKEPGQTTYNYAKVLIKKVGDKFLQGTADDRFVECVISYQKVPNIPYAR